MLLPRQQARAAQPEPQRVEVPVEVEVPVPVLDDEAWAAVNKLHGQLDEVLNTCTLRLPLRQPAPPRPQPRPKPQPAPTPTPAPAPRTEPAGELSKQAKAMLEELARRYPVTRRLPTQAAAFLAHLVDAHPREVSRPELAEATGYSLTSSSFGPSIRQLVKLGLVHDHLGQLTAADELVM